MHLKYLQEYHVSRLLGICHKSGKFCSNLSFPVGLHFDQGAITLNDYAANKI